MALWTTTAKVDAALGAGSGAAADPYLADCVDAANAWCFRKREQAGYDDDPAVDAAAPSPDVAMGATLYAVALWRERASVEGFQSFGEIGAWSPTGGSLGQIKRLLAIPRAAVDTAPEGTAITPLAWRRARRGRVRL